MVTRQRGRSTPPPRAARGFFSRVFALVRAIPSGHVATYGQLARALGAPRGARVVGWSLRACPEDVPWHRVVNAGGRISWRLSGGASTQRRRLEQEGVRFDRTGQIDLDVFGWRKI